MTKSFFETKKYNKNDKNKKKFSNQDILSANAFKSTRDAEWFKRTLDKIEQIKHELDMKFYSEEKRKGKIDFIRMLKNKVKDYRDAQKNAELYKSIRFFERRKLERMLTQINKKINDNVEEKDKESLIKEKNRIVDDINYVKFFPLNYKYYSLFPKKDIDNPETIRKRKKIRNKILIYLNTKKNRQHMLMKEGEQADDILNISDSEESIIEEDNDVNLSKNDKSEKINKSTTTKSIEPKEHKKESKKEEVIKSKPKNKKILEKDYEDENIYKDTIGKDDFFILD